MISIILELLFFPLSLYLFLKNLVYSNKKITYIIHSFIEHSSNIEKTGVYNIGLFSSISYVTIGFFSSFALNLLTKYIKLDISPAIIFSLISSMLLLITGYLLNSVILFLFCIGYILSCIISFLYGEEVILFKNSVKLNLEYNTLTILRASIVGLFLILLIYSLNISVSSKFLSSFLVVLFIVFIGLQIRAVNIISYAFYVYFNNFALNLFGENFINKLENKEKYFFSNNKKIYTHNTYNKQCDNRNINIKEASETVDNKGLLGSHDDKLLDIVIFNNMQINHNEDKSINEFSNNKNSSEINIEIIGVGESSFEIDELYNKLEQNISKDFYNECINSCSHLKIFNLSVLEILLFLENFGNIPSVVSEENRRFSNYHQVSNSYEILRKQTLIEHSIMVATLIFSQNTELRETHSMEICILVGLCHDLGKIYGFKNVSSYKLHQHPKSSITIMNTEFAYIKNYKYFELVESIVFNHHRDNSYLSKTATEFKHELLDLFQTFDGKARRLYLEKYIEKERSLRNELIDEEAKLIDQSSGCFEYGSVTKSFDDILEDIDKKESKADKYEKRRRNREEIKNRLIEKTVSNIESQLEDQSGIILEDFNSNNETIIDSEPVINMDHDINTDINMDTGIEVDTDNESNSEIEVEDIDDEKDVDIEVNDEVGDEVNSLELTDDEEIEEDETSDDSYYEDCYDREAYDPDAAFIENVKLEVGFNEDEMDEVEILHLENMKKQSESDYLDIPDEELVKFFYPNIEYDDRFDNVENDGSFKLEGEDEIIEELIYDNELDVIKEISDNYEEEKEDIIYSNIKKKKRVNKNSENISMHECNKICDVADKNKEYVNDDSNFFYKEFGLKENEDVDLSAFICEKDFIFYFEKKINVIKNGKAVAFTVNDDLVLLSLDSLIFFVETMAKNKGVRSLNSIKNPEHRFKVMLSSVVHLLRQYNFVDNRYIGPNFSSAPFSIRDYSDTIIVDKKFFVPIKITAFELIGDFEYFDKRKKGDLARYALCKNNFKNIDKSNYKKL